MNLLLEIGAEEIPDWMLTGALDYLSSALADLLKQNNLGETEIQTDATPRRLVVRTEGIIPRQPDTEERIWGPAKTAPAQAVSGFAKKQGLDANQLEIHTDGKAEKYTYLRKTPGRPAAQILAEALPQLILKTPFPKTMYWSDPGDPLHPPHPLDRSAPRRPNHPLRNRRRPLRQPIQRPPQTRRRPLPGHLRHLRRTTPRKLRNPLRRRAPRPHPGRPHQIQMR